MRVNVCACVTVTASPQGLFSLSDACSALALALQCSAVQCTQTLLLLLHLLTMSAANCSRTLSTSALLPIPSHGLTFNASDRAPAAWTDAGIYKIGGDDGRTGGGKESWKGSALLMLTALSLKMNEKKQ